MINGTLVIAPAKRFIASALVLTFTPSISAAANNFKLSQGIFTSPPKILTTPENNAPITSALINGTSVIALAKSFIASALVLTFAPSISTAPNFLSCVNGSSAPKNLPRAPVIPPTSVPRPDTVAPAPPAAIAVKNIPIASAFFIAFLVLILTLLNSSNITSGLLAPIISPNLLNAPPTKPPIPATTVPPPIAANPTATAPIPKPTSIKLSPSRSSKLPKPSASVGNALPIIHDAAAIPAPTAAIDKPNIPAPINTCGLNALNPPAIPCISPLIACPTPLPSLPTAPAITSIGPLPAPFPPLTALLAAAPALLAAPIPGILSKTFPIAPLIAPLTFEVNTPINDFAARIATNPAVITPTTLSQLTSSNPLPIAPKIISPKLFISP